MAPEKARQALDKLCQEAASFGGTLTAEQILQAIDDAGGEVVTKGLPVYQETDD